jgi:hypothetical protein
MASEGGVGKTPGHDGHPQRHRRHHGQRGSPGEPGTSGNHDEEAGESEPSHDGGDVRAHHPAPQLGTVSIEQHGKDDHGGGARHECLYQRGDHDHGSRIGKARDAERHGGQHGGDAGHLGSAGLASADGECDEGAQGEELGPQQRQEAQDVAAEGELRTRARQGDHHGGGGVCAGQAQQYGQLVPASA